MVKLIFPAHKNLAFVVEKLNHGPKNCFNYQALHEVIHRKDIEPDPSQRRGTDLY